MSTEQKIVDKALELFNAAGIEYVGMRELAAALDMRIGNLTYYFPTKDALVNRLAQDLRTLNSQTLVPVEHMTMTGLLELLQAMFRNQSRYRCLMLSFVHLMEQNPILARNYKKTEKTRNEAWRINLKALVKAGYIQVKAPTDMDYLVSAIALIARFWLSEAAVSYKHLDTAAQIRHYTGIVARMLRPFASEEGLAEIRRFLRR